MRIELLYMSAEKLLYYLGTYPSWEILNVSSCATDVAHWFVRQGASTVQLILSEAKHPITEVV